MTKKNDKKPARTARLQVTKEILRNLSADQLAGAQGGAPPTCGGPCPRSKQPE